MSNRHTPGPWRLETDYAGRAYRIKAEAMPEWKDCWPATSSEGRVFVCEFKHYEFKGNRDYSETGQALLAEVNNANAALIAAAPEMLTVIKNAFAYLDATGLEGREDEQQLHAELAAAIAKAEGRTE